MNKDLGCCILHLFVFYPVVVAVELIHRIYARSKSKAILSSYQIYSFIILIPPGQSPFILICNAYFSEISMMGQISNLIYLLICYFYL